MGCIGSKAVVAPEPPSGGSPVSQQQGDDSNKPWKKNQVVPAPPPAPEGPSRQHQPLKTPTAFAASGKDTKQGTDQGPVDVLGSLKELCAEKVDGAGLANLAERIYDVLKHHLVGALRSASSPKDSAVVVELVKRAVTCCNSILQPVLSHINRVLSNKQAGSSWSETTSWEQVEFSDFLGVLEDACTANYDQGVMDVGRPVAALMELIYELRQHCQANKIQLSENSTQVAALDELVGMLGIIFFRKVVLETAESAQAKLEQYQQLQEQVGWSDAQLGCCTGPQARAMLMYLNQVSAAGEKRTNVMVRRCAAFWDAFECARKDGLLPAPSGPMSHKYFPLFVDVFAHGGQAGEAAVSGGRKPAVEAGEGHGPRKEFFILAGQDMAGQQPAQHQHPTSASCADDERSSRQQRGQQERPDSAGSQRPSRPPLWVFNRTAGAFWYNTGLTESAELRGAYAFAGWLLGQSLLNRAPLGLRLPPVLFQALLEGPGAGGSASGAAAAEGGGGSAGGGGFQPTLEMLAEFDPDAASGVRNVAALPADQLRGMLELEGLPTDWTAERYTQHAAATVLRDGVAWQAASVAAGFFAAVDRRLLRTWQLGPAALAALTAGSGAAGEAPADLSTLFRLAIDEELSGPSAVLVELLWQVLAGWPGERRLRFVEFVTGTQRLPLPGSELLKIQAPFVAMGAAEHQATLGMLPQAHTCDNLLELPNYWESLLAVRGVRGGPLAVSRGTAALSEEQLAEIRAEARRILDDRLTLAVTNFQGYGLDERSGSRWGGELEADGAGELGSTLSGPEPSPEPDMRLKPAALTADSLASLARLSASSSILHSSHPLAFSTAAAAVSQSGGQRGGAPPPLRPGAPPPVRGSAPVGLAGGGELRPPPQQLVLSADVGVMPDAERQAALLARFDVDIEEKKARPPGSGRDASLGLAPPIKRPSSSEQSHDVFK